MLDPSTVLTGSVGILIISLLFSIYSLYLNWKQSRVKNQMEELICFTHQNLLVNRDILLKLRSKK